LGANHGQNQLLQAASRLENLRQEVKESRKAAGSAASYLDYGNPDPEQKKAAQERMATLQQRSQEQQELLAKTIEDMRQNFPEALRA
jgi:hypothetical protein